MGIINDNSNGDNDKININKDIDNLVDELNSQIKFEKLIIKFGNKLVLICNNIKNENYIYHDLYYNYLSKWNQLSLIKENSNLYNLTHTLLKNDISNIRKTIISSITYEKLKDDLFLNFIEDFIDL